MVVRNRWRMALKYGRAHCFGRLGTVEKGTLLPRAEFTRLGRQGDVPGGLQCPDHERQQEAVKQVPPTAGVNHLARQETCSA